MAHYKYYFGDLRTEGVLAEIDCYGTYMDLELNAGGSWNGSFQLDQEGKRNQDLLSATIPGFSYVMVERNGIVIWGGFIWSRTYQSQSKDVQLFASSFEKYPAKQRILTDLVLGPDDLRNLFVLLWNDMQSVPGRNLSINIPPATFSPVITNGLIQVLATDFKFYSEVMSSLADGDIGFDWYIACSRDGNYFKKDLKIGFPTIGETLNNNSLIFDYPGAILNYYQTEAMANAGTHVIVTGAGDGSNMPVGTASQDIMIDQGWPRWDAVVSRKDLTSQILVDSFAAQQSIILKPPQTTIKATMKGDETPEFGSWGLGDTVRVIIRDARNPNTLEFDGRIVKWTLNPPSKDNTEEYALIFQGDDNG